MGKKFGFDWKKLKRVIVLIDAANIEKSAKDLGWKVHYRKLRRFFKRNTILVDIAFYSVTFDTEKHQDFLLSLKRIGYRLRTKPLKLIDDRLTNQYVRKANFDVEIAIDVLNQVLKYDTLVLFSGDSDFDYLVKYLQARKKQVIVVSFRGHISRELARSADRYIPLTKIPDVLKKNHPDLRRGK